MASSLIGLLNANATKTPDEIVTALATKGWILGADMTQDQYDALHEGPDGGRVRLTCWQDYTDLNQWWQGGLTTVHCYRMRDWPLSEINHALAEYYFIPYGEYKNGSLPNRPA